MRTKAILIAVCLAVLFLSLGRMTAQSATTIPAEGQMQPAELTRLLQPGSTPPLIIQAGSKVFFAEAHIRGSVYAGPGSTPAGLKALEGAVTASPKNRPIVLYCGCCPWNRCPNVGPAFARLKSLGYNNVKVLYLPNNFGDDWVSKGYPTDHN